MSNPKILVIEDDRINCIIYETILEDSGVSLEFAYDGEQGISKFRADEYDLVLLDLGLPKIDGLTVAREIRKFELTAGKSRTPVIIITANSSPQTRQNIMEVDVDDYMFKPFDL